MRTRCLVAVVVAAVAAIASCSRSEAPAKRTGEPEGMAVVAPSPIDAGKPLVRPRSLPARHAAIVRIVYACFQSDQPWGNGHSSWSTAVDLDASTATLDREHVPTNGKMDDVVEPAKAETSHRVARVDLAHVRELVAKLDTSGPYGDEVPVPEGISCDLTLAGKTGEPFFKIDKEPNAKSGDAIVQLIHALPPP